MHSSDLRKISCGVPQGSVLGPLVFLAYINDLPNISRTSIFFLFADDTNLYHEADSLKKLERVVNTELKWLNLSVNRLALNIKPTNFVIFHPFNKPPKETITLQINKKWIIEVKKIYRYLGVLIYSSLSWKYHIENLTKKISRAIGVMYKIRGLINTDILKTLYYSLIYPDLFYAIQVWGNTFDCHLNKIIVLQKKAIRMMALNDNNLTTGHFLLLSLYLRNFKFLKLVIFTKSGLYSLYLIA